MPDMIRSFAHILGGKRAVWGNGIQQTQVFETCLAGSFVLSDSLRNLAAERYESGQPVCFRSSAGSSHPAADHCPSFRIMDRNP